MSAMSPGCHILFDELYFWFFNMLGLVIGVQRSLLKIACNGDFKPFLGHFQLFRFEFKLEFFIKATYVLFKN